jgi:hypothetical protein
VKADFDVDKAELVQKYKADARPDGRTQNACRWLLKQATSTLPE